jgi:glycosyltransferase involved in cell wall biosynthesis
MKTVGLVAAKGEGRRIEYCLRALARITDEIVYFDDNSPDHTLEVVYSLQQECRVARIIESHLPDRNEGRDRQELLNAGRDIGGDRFIVLDADEAFAADAEEYLRLALEVLKPGESISAPWTHLWRGADRYRVDPCPWVNNWRKIAFADDGTNYPEVYLHTPRVPVHGQDHGLPNEVVFLHFQFIFWPNVVVKQTWYKMLERQRTELTVDHLNWAYDQALNETGLKTEPSKNRWFYSFFDESVFMRLYHWRIAEMKAWKAANPQLYEKLLPCPYVD